MASIHNYGLHPAAVESHKPLMPQASLIRVYTSMVQYKWLDSIYLFMLRIYIVAYIWRSNETEGI